MKLFNWLKESNRYKHLIGGILIGLGVIINTLAANPVLGAFLFSFGLLTIIDLQIRNKYGLNVIALGNEERTTANVQPNYKIQLKDYGRVFIFTNFLMLIMYPFNLTFNTNYIFSTEIPANVMALYPWLKYFPPMITLEVVGLAISGAIYYFLVRRRNLELAAEIKEEPKEMIKTLEGYDVLGQIKVEGLEIDTYILDSVDEGALEKASGKITGDELNETGNFCVIGHNYDNIFAKLSEIEKNETITIVDPKLNETEYKVTDVFTVEPDDLKPLLNTEDAVRLTLITCEPSGTTRLVVVAEVVEETDTVVENTVEESDTEE